MPQATNKELLSAIDEAINEMSSAANAFTPQQYNTVPNGSGWTPGQVLQHVTKSLRGMASAIQMPGEPANRDPESRVPELRKVFLDFSHKMKSPEFILPEERRYEQAQAVEALRNAAGSLEKQAGSIDLDTLVNGLPFGPITKLELLHFTLVHTKRHIHQLEQMQEAFA